MCGRPAMLRTWVKTRRSLLPLISPGWSSKWPVRKSFSVNLYAWIAVPIAPSMIMMRSDIVFVR